MPSNSHQKKNWINRNKLTPTISKWHSGTKRTPRGQHTVSSAGYPVSRAEWDDQYQIHMARQPLDAAAAPYPVALYSKRNTWHTEVINNTAYTEYFVTTWDDHPESSNCPQFSCPACMYRLSTLYICRFLESFFLLPLVNIHIMSYKAPFAAVAYCFNLDGKEGFKGKNIISRIKCLNWPKSRTCRRSCHSMHVGPLLQVMSIYGVRRTKYYHEIWTFTS